MRRLCVATLLLLLGLHAIATNGEEVKPSEKPQPPMFQGGVTHGNRFIGLRRDGHLVKQDLLWGTSRDYGNLGAKLQPAIDYLGDKVCVASKEQVYVVDLASSKAIYTAKHSGGLVDVAFLDAEHIYTVNHRMVEVFDVSADKPPRTITLRPKAKDAPTDRQGGFGGFYAWNGEEPLPNCRRENLPYVALPADGEPSSNRNPRMLATLSDVAVVDLVKGDVVNTVSLGLGGGIIDLYVTRDSSVEHDMLYVCQGSYSYGILRKRFLAFPVKGGQIDTKSKAVRNTELPTDWRLERGGNSAARFFAPHGQLYLAHGSKVIRFNSNGKPIDEASNAVPVGANMVGAWSKGVVIAEATGIRRVELSPIKTAAEAKKPQAE